MKRLTITLTIILLIALAGIASARDDCAPGCGVPTARATNTATVAPTATLDIVVIPSGLNSLPPTAAPPTLAWPVEYPPPGPTDTPEAYPTFRYQSWTPTPRPTLTPWSPPPGYTPPPTATPPLPEG